MLEALRTDYTEVAGRPFEHFFCPMLYKDENVPLCGAHVINEAFVGADRTQTIQRKDVDGFFGTLFESEFEKLQHKGQHEPHEVIADPELSRKLKPTLVSDGEVVGYYRQGGATLPPEHTDLEFGQESGKCVRLALKMEPTKVLERLTGDWHFEIRLDLRLPALVSLLKVAHLTLFHQVGYSYALSAGGYFFGNNILGQFFRSNRNLPRAEQLKNAERHFREYVNLARPVLSAPSGFTGTLSDGLFLFCLNQGRPFAFLVYLETGDFKHAVMVPILEDVESAVRFDSFLRRPSPTIEVKVGRYRNKAWEVAPDTATVAWPKANFD